MMKLEDYTMLINKCSQCNFCQASCPVFKAMGTENWLARNRINLIREVLVEKTMEDSVRFREILDACLLCTGCTQTCSSMVPVDEIITAAKSSLNEGESSFASLKKSFVKGVMKNNGFRDLITKTGAIVQKIGIADNFPRLASKTFYSRFNSEIAADGNSRGRVAYYAGCGTNLIYPEAGEALVKIVSAAGFDIALPQGVGCCGIPLLAEGDIEGGAEMLRMNIDILSDTECDRIIMECTSCLMMFRKKGAKLFSADDPVQEKLKAINDKLADAADFILDKASPAEKGTEKTFTYHMPCHRDKTWGSRNSVVNMIKALTGAGYNEMDDPESCCGAGGTYYLRNSKMASKIRESKMKSVNSIDADFIVTECPMCRFYIQQDVKDMKVVHPLEFIADNL